MAKKLGIDYGNKIIGLAISDNDNKIALGYGIIENEDMEDSIYRISKLIDKEDIDTIIVGIPLGLKNIITTQTDTTLKFIDKLEDEIDITIEKIDERFTTKIAQDFIKTKKNSKIGDKDIKAAQIILQDYLDKINN
jgi:putative Holliday junction resolvase